MARTQPDFSGNPYFTKGYFPQPPNLNPVQMAAPRLTMAGDTGPGGRSDSAYRQGPPQEQVGGGQAPTGYGTGGSWADPQVPQPGRGAHTRFGPRAFNPQPGMGTMPVQPVPYQDFRNLLDSIPQRTLPQPRSQGFTQNWMAGRRTPDRTEGGARTMETGA